VATDKVIVCFAFALVAVIIAVVVIITVDPTAIKGQTTQAPASAIG